LSLAAAISSTCLANLSGGDLDGDIYNVIRDPQVMQNPNDRLSVFEPADHPRVVPQVLDREVTKDDMAQFFIDFIKADKLGVIATRHMTMVDMHSALNPICLKLAQLHSTAVDFSKPGRPVNVSDLPRGPKARPDFDAAPSACPYGSADCLHSS
jgi:hypothetical protein